MGYFQDFLSECRFYPMLSDRNSLGHVLTESELTRKWMLFDRLPEETKDILSSQEISDRIGILQKEYRLPDELTETVSAIIRELFLEKKDNLWLENVLTARLNRSVSLPVKDFIQKNILSIRVKKEKTKDASSGNIAFFPILDALAKFQRLSEQTITEDRIVVKGETQPVRGSLRNWIRNYRDTLGIRKHSAIERGQFLFQGENTKRLSSAERERLSLIFRSIDENIPVSVDVDRQEVIFPLFEEKPTTNTPLPQNASVQMGTSFREKELFPAKTTQFQKSIEWNPDTANQIVARKPPAPSVMKKNGDESGKEIERIVPGKISFSSKHMFPSEQDGGKAE